MCLSILINLPNQILSATEQGRDPVSLEESFSCVFYEFMFKGVKKMRHVKRTNLTLVPSFPQQTMNSSLRTLYRAKHTAYRLSKRTFKRLFYNP